jgi:heat shock protein HslJ
MKSRVTTPFVVVVLLVGACGGAGDAGGEPVGTTTWVLTAGTVDGLALTLAHGYPVTFQVENGQAGGTAACNHYGGSILLAGNAVSFPEGLFQTEMACLEPGVMELESGFLGALLRVTGSASGGGELRLTGPGIELRFAAAAPEPDASLVGTWWLETLIEGDAASTVAAPASLHIDDQGAVTGSTGCNTLFGSYEAASGFSRLGTTKMACEPLVMEQEGLLMSVFDSDPLLSIEGSTLTITAGDGSALIYRADG